MPVPAIAPQLPRRLDDAEAPIGIAKTRCSDGLRDLGSECGTELGEGIQVGLVRRVDQDLDRRAKDIAVAPFELRGEEPHLRDADGRPETVRVGLGRGLPPAGPGHQPTGRHLDQDVRVEMVRCGRGAGSRGGQPMHGGHQCNVIRRENRRGLAKQPQRVGRGQAQGVDGAVEIGKVGIWHAAAAQRDGKAAAPMLLVNQNGKDPSPMGMCSRFAGDTDAVDLHARIQAEPEAAGTGAPRESHLQVDFERPPGIDPDHCAQAIDVHVAGW